MCVAPFIVTTINPQGNQAPCPTLGGDLWDFKDVPLKVRWSGPELVQFREDMLADKQLPVCVRCHAGEASGGYSFRKQLYKPLDDPEGVLTHLIGSTMTPDQIINTELYKDGPMQIVMKVNNVCNLRCRTCNSNDSVLFKIEGKHYQKKHGVTEYMYLNGPDATYWSDQQLKEIFDFSSNLRRLEFYGGEPLLDKQTPKLLKMFSDSGQSKKIALNISTNCTIRPDRSWAKMISKFENFNLSMSIDGIGPHFHYIRHPAKWDEVLDNINYFVSLRNKISNFYILPTITVSIYNIFYLPEIYQELKNITGIDPHLNLVYNPNYYRINNLPDGVKNEVTKKLSPYSQFDELVNFINTERNEQQWEMFKFWVNAKDEYRDEQFAHTFPEFTAIILKHDKLFPMQTNFKNKIMFFIKKLI